MDRRQKRTRNAIFQAMSKLLAQKHFENITVQEIIDEADIGRSTFYSHFATKDDLLHELFGYSFWQISTDAQAEAESGGGGALEKILAMIFAQGKMYKQIVLGLYAGETSELFARYLEKTFEELFHCYLSEFDPGIPEKYLLHLLSSSLTETLRWWIAEGCPGTPEEMASYYLTVMRRK